MGIAQTVNNHHWNYLLALDADAAELSRYIEFTPKNYKTYSLELARLLMSAAAEVDVVAKLACAQVAPGGRAERIGEYYSVLSKSRTNLRSYRVEIKRFGLLLTPWIDWTKARSPIWWRACNVVKHRRDTGFPEANLKNALNAVAGLYVMLLYAFPDDAQQGKLFPRTQLFSIPAPFISGYGPIEDGTPIAYRL
jgi:hypothetical protein